MHFFSPLWVILCCVQIKWQTTGSHPRPEQSRYTKSLKPYYSSCDWMKTKNKLRKALHCTTWLHNHHGLVWFVFFFNQSKAETKYVQEFVLRLIFFCPVAASFEMFRCGLWVRSEKNTSDKVKMERNLLLEKNHLFCQERGDKRLGKMEKRGWQFLNSKGICRTASCQRLQETWSFHNESRTNYLRKDKRISSPHKPKKLSYFISIMWKKENKNLPWELGNSEEYTHNLEKKGTGEYV